MSVNELDQVRPDLEGTPEDELRRLIERAHQIEMLTQHPGWSFFRDYLIHMTTTTQRYVLDGRCKSFDEYAAKTGYVRGIQEAIEAPGKLLSQVANLQAEREGSNL